MSKRRALSARRYRRELRRRCRTRPVTGVHRSDRRPAGRGCQGWENLLARRTHHLDHRRLSCRAHQGCDHQRGIETILGVPLSEGDPGRCAGIGRDSAALSPEEVTLLMAVGGQIGAIENGRLYRRRSRPAAAKPSAAARWRRGCRKSSQCSIHGSRSRRPSSSLQVRRVGCWAAMPQPSCRWTSPRRSFRCKHIAACPTGLPVACSSGWARRASTQRGGAAPVMVMSDTAVELEMVAAGQMPGNMPQDFVETMAHS